MPLILPIKEKIGIGNLKKSKFNEFSIFRRRLLSQQESESLLDGDSLPAVLVFRRKSKNKRIQKCNQKHFLHLAGWALKVGFPSGSTLAMV